MCVREREGGRENQKEKYRKRYLQRDENAFMLHRESRQTERNQALDMFINILQLKVLSVNEFVCLFVP